MATIASDTFNRTDSTTALGTSDGPGSLVWSALVATWGISTNKAYNVDAINGAQAVLDVGTPTQSSQADVSGGTNCYVTCRVTDASNSYLGGLNSGSAYQLYKVVAGGFTLLGNSGTSDTTATLKMVCNGTAIALWVNGSSLLTATDGDLTTGNKAGLYNGSGSNASRWDNFTVDDLIVASAGFIMNRFTIRHTVK